MKYANTINQCRFNINMTQQELADLVGVTVRTIQSIETGASRPSVKYALIIAGVFGKTVDEVFILPTDD